MVIKSRNCGKLQNEVKCHHGNQYKQKAVILIG